MVVGQEGSTLLLHPEGRIPGRSTLKEAHMAAALGKDQRQERVCFDRGSGKCRPGQKGMVSR